MFCPECGNENTDTSRFCVKCGGQLQGSQQVPRPAAPPPVTTQRAPSPQPLPAGIPQPRKPLGCQIATWVLVVLAVFFMLAAKFAMREGDYDAYNGLMLLGVLLGVPGVALALYLKKRG